MKSALAIEYCVVEDGKMKDRTWPFRNQTELVWVLKQMFKEGNVIPTSIKILDGKELEFHELPRDVQQEILKRFGEFPE